MTVLQVDELSFRVWTVLQVAVLQVGCPSEGLSFRWAVLQVDCPSGSGGLSSGSGGLSSRCPSGGLLYYHLSFRWTVLQVYCLSIQMCSVLCRWNYTSGAVSFSRLSFRYTVLQMGYTSSGLCFRLSFR